MVPNLDSAARHSTAKGKWLGMKIPKVYIVHLRQPDQRNPDESRSDPYFEFGSFGCTGCHSRNLLHPKRAAILHGARLAFAQGGSLGFRLILLTPPITITEWEDRLEARWEPAFMPFRYDTAPILVSNSADSDFPKLETIVLGTARTTVEGGFSICFRSRSTPLDDPTARELVRIYDNRR
jgi:hypothetical protein